MIKIEHLNRWYEIDKKKHYILKDINLNIKRGECIVLKGVSGSGKTSLLSIIAGLDKPNSGKVLIDGEPIYKLPDIHLSNFRAKKIGIVFQDFNLIEDITILDNVLVPLIALKIPLKEAKKSALKALEAANIAHKANKRPKELSGGEKQRAAIARALASNANIILCDEPTANLDMQNSLEFIKTIKELHAQNKTILIATHDPLFDNLSCPHKIINIKNGKIDE